MCPISNWTCSSQNVRVNVSTFISVNCSFQCGSLWYFETFYQIASFHAISHKEIPETPTHFNKTEELHRKIMSFSQKCFSEVFFCYKKTGYVGIFGVSQKGSSYKGENIVDSHFQETDVGYLTVTYLYVACEMYSFQVACIIKIFKRNSTMLLSQ